jgi:hypothetical protein
MSTAMTLSCRACAWSWGPVGVLPFFPGGPDQRFLRCAACDTPQARVLAPGQRVEALACAACGAVALVPLAHCPRCGGGVDWGP